MATVVTVPRKNVDNVMVEILTVNKFSGGAEHAILDVLTDCLLNIFYHQKRFMSKLFEKFNISKRSLMFCN